MKRRTGAAERDVPPLTFVVESVQDVELVRHLLASAAIQQDAHYFAAQETTSLASLARNVLIFERDPVMLVADSEGEPAEQVRNENMQALEATETPVPFDVFVFSPSLSAVATKANHPQIRAFLESVAKLQASLTPQQPVQ